MSLLFPFGQEMKFRKLSQKLSLANSQSTTLNHLFWVRESGEREVFHTFASHHTSFMTNAGLSRCLMRRSVRPPNFRCLYAVRSLYCSVLRLSCRELSKNIYNLTALLNKTHAAGIKHRPSKHKGRFYAVFQLSTLLFRCKNLK